MNRFALVSLCALWGLACGGAKPAPPESAVMTTRGTSAPSTAATCATGSIPAGPNHQCVKTCTDTAQCTGGQECRPTSWEVAPGQLSHDSACF